MRLAIQQAAVLCAFQGIGVTGAGELALHGRQVAQQRAQRAQQAAPGGVVLLPQVRQRGFEILSRLGIGLAVDERLAQADGRAQFHAGARLQLQQALTAVQHVAVEEGFGQGLIGVMRGADPLVQVLGKKVQLQVMVDPAPGRAIAEAMQQGFLGLVQRGHHAAVLLGQLKAAFFEIQLQHRLEQRRLEPEVFAQLPIQAGQAVLHRLVGEDRVPQDRQQPVPGRARDQQQ